MCERYVISDLFLVSILDTETGDTYPLQDEGIFETVCDLMNEQDRLIDELYEFRLLYNAHLFNEWVENEKYEVYKSRKHYDGEVCFDGDWFIVVAILPTGQITNHYNLKDWDLFKIPEYECVKHEYDGHMPYDVLKRLREMF